VLRAQHGRHVEAAGSGHGVPPGVPSPHTRPPHRKVPRQFELSPPAPFFPSLLIDSVLVLSRLETLIAACCVVTRIVSVQGSAEQAGAAGGVHALSRAARSVRGGACLPARCGNEGYVSAATHPSVPLCCT
jgi:hypothetical protein